MELFTAAVTPGLMLGPFALGASLHEVLSLVKEESSRYPSIDLHYSHSEPLVSPVIVSLRANGLRLRFDGADQRLRLIEVVDFSKIRLQHKSSDLIKVHEDGQATSGPAFKRVYSLLGPSYPGEYMPPTDKSLYGTYVLSWPGIAFNFPLLQSAWSKDKDHVSLLGSHVALPAKSMALFEGKSWAEARRDLFVKQPVGPRMSSLLLRQRDNLPAEIEAAEVRGDGKVELVRLNPPSIFTIVLNETTTQDLLTELGPPDVTHRREEPVVAEEQPSRRRPSSVARPSPSGRLHPGSQPSSYSSTGTDTFETDFDSSNAEDDVQDRTARQKFWCYFSHGVDILVGPAVDHARCLTSNDAAPLTPLGTSTATVVLKVIIHGNVPGSYAFNRHRRLRWTLNLSPDDDKQNKNLPTESSSSSLLTSEHNFDTDIKPLLLTTFSPYLPEAEMARGKVVNRTWTGGANSSDSSFFLPDTDEDLGMVGMGFEDGGGGMDVEGEDEGGSEQSWLGNTKLFAFPGMIFEVLENGAVSALTVCLS